MSVAYYMDANVHAGITNGLRLRGVDVITAQEDGQAATADPDILDRAGALGRVLFTQDKDFLAEAAIRQLAGQSFTGVVYAHQRRVAIGTCVDELELIALLTEPAELVDRVTYLPMSAP